MAGKQLVRRPDDGMIAGVAAGVAERCDIDVTLVRLAFVALAIVSAGTAIVLYLVAAVIMPRADETPGVDSFRHGVDDLVTRGRGFFDETRKVVDRTTSRPNPINTENTVEPPAKDPVTASSTQQNGPSV